MYCGAQKALLLTFLHDYVEILAHLAYLLIILPEDVFLIVQLRKILLLMVLRIDA